MALAPGFIHRAKAAVARVMTVPLIVAAKRLDPPKDCSNGGGGLAIAGSTGHSKVKGEPLPTVPIPAQIRVFSPPPILEKESLYELDD